jgi:hypothetical protein
MRKTNKQRYQERTQRAKAFGFKSYPEERKFRRKIARDLQTAVENGLIEEVPGPKSNEFRLLLLAKGQVKGGFVKGTPKLSDDMRQALWDTFGQEDAGRFYSIVKGLY